MLYTIGTRLLSAVLVGTSLLSSVPATATSLTSSVDVDDDATSVVLVEDETETDAETTESVTNDSEEVEEEADGGSDDDSACYLSIQVAAGVDSTFELFTSDEPADYDGEVLRYGVVDYYLSDWDYEVSEETNDAGDYFLTWTMPDGTSTDTTCIVKETTADGQNNYLGPISVPYVTSSKPYNVYVGHCDNQGGVYYYFDMSFYYDGSELTFASDEANDVGGLYAELFSTRLDPIDVLGEDTYNEIVQFVEENNEGLTEDDDDWLNLDDVLEMAMSGDYGASTMSDNKTTISGSLESVYQYDYDTHKFGPSDGVVNDSGTFKFYRYDAETSYKFLTNTLVETSTYAYWTTAYGVDHIAFCANYNAEAPSKDGSTRYYLYKTTASSVSNSAYLIAALLLSDKDTTLYNKTITVEGKEVTYHDYVLGVMPNYNSTSYYGDYGAYAVGHSLISYIFTGDYKKNVKSDDWQPVAKSRIYTLLTTDDYFRETVYNSIAYIAVATNTSQQKQQMVFVAETVPESSAPGYAYVQKVSSAPDMTNNNSCYSLSGAEYTIYTDSGCTTVAKDASTGKDAVLVTDSTGKSGTATLTPGTYYAKETKASSGFYYDNATYTLTVEEDKTVSFTSTEKPMNDPFVVKITKEDSSGTNSLSLAGAQFTIKYYDGYYDSVSALPSTATRTWVVQTKQVGSAYRASLATDFLVSGTLYTDANGVVICPLGTYTFEETKAPSGYAISGTMSFKGNNSVNVNGGVLLTQVINIHGTVTVTGGNNVTATNEIIVKEEAVRGGFSIQKKDSDSKSNSAQGNATNLTTQMEVVNSNSYSVWVDTNGNGVVDSGETFASGAVCYTFTTNSDGYYESSKSLLPYGTYTIRETSAPTGYLNTSGSNTSTVTISANKQIAAATAIADEVYRGGFTMTKWDADTNESQAQGNGSLVGVVYNVYNRSTNTVYVDSNGDGVREAFAPGAVVYTFKTDKNNGFTSASNLLPYGTYEIVEATPSIGYLADTIRNGSIKTTFSITKNGEMVDLTNKVFVDPIKRGGVMIQKVNADNLYQHATTAQGDATFANTTFAIINRSTNSVTVDVNQNGKIDKSTETFAPGATITTLTTDAEGKASTPTLYLPYGTYEIVETVAPTGYLNTDAQGDVWSKTISITDEDSMIDLTYTEDSVTNAFGDSVIRGGVTIQKNDADVPASHSTTAQGDATLEGATYNVYNRSASGVWVDKNNNGKFDDDEWFEPGEVCYVLTTDANGKASTSADCLPYGTYEIVEDTPSTGYLATTDRNGVISKTITIRENGQIVDLTYNEENLDSTFYEAVIRGGVAIQKNDADVPAINSTTAQGDATFEGAVYNIYNRSANGVWVDKNGDGKYSEDEYFAPGEICYVLTTDAEGKASTASDCLPYGTYEIIEADASTGYLASSERDGVISQTFQVREEGKVVDLTYDLSDLDKTFYEPVIRGGVKIQKNDADVYVINSTTAQGDATFKGAVYNVYNRSASYVWVDKNNDGKYSEDECFAPGEICYVLTTDANGLASTSADCLPYGSYEIIEATPSIGYLATAIRGGVITHSFTIRSEGQMVDFTYKSDDLDSTFYEAIIRGGFEFQKRDEETGLATPLGGANLQGTYTVTNLSDSYVWVDTNEDGVYTEDECYAPNEVVYTFQTDKYTGYFKSSDTLLPYGTYKITEVKAPQGYLSLSDRNSSLSVTFQVREEGTIYDETETIYNYVKRGDVYFHKINAKTSQAMAYIPFRITALDQDGNEIESHIVYTDINGDFNSHTSYALHTYNTNAGDQGYADSLATYETTGTYGENEYTTGGVGTWFGVGTEASDDLRLTQTGALPYGVYKIEELPCERNAGMELYSDTFVINSELSTTDVNVDADGYQNGSMSGFVFFGTILNWPDTAPTISTEALDEETGTHYATPSDDSVIVDTVTYNNLKIGDTYTLVATLYDADTFEAITDANGDPITETETFTTSLEHGYAKVSLFVDSAEFAGKNVVVYEELYDATNTLVAKHTDPTDKNQQIHYPEIGTQATDKNTGLQLVNADGEVTIVDTVSYTNLEPKRTYTVTGYLVDKATGDYLTDANGKQITASQKFKPTASTGTVDVEFTLDASALEGKTIVAFEAVSKSNTIVATHADIDDVDQTIYFPAIGTKTYDAETGTNMVADGSVITIVDTVMYSNLMPGLTYTMTGTLVDKTTGETVLDADGNEVVAETSFVAESESGSVDVIFTYDQLAEEHDAMVAFETLYYQNVKIADHSDLTDEDETVYIPKIGTTATDANSGLQMVEASDSVEIKDTVSYSNLSTDYSYVVTGYLVDAQTGTPMTDAKGEIITASAEFTPETMNGSVDVVFTFDGSALAGKTAVAYEYLSAVIDGKNVPLTSHEDITDEGQTIYFPNIYTNAHDSVTEDNVAMASEITIVDVVTYENLMVGEEYTVTGKLIDKSTQTVIQDVDGKDVTAQTTFTATSANGEVEVTFTFDASNLAGKTLVAYEELFCGKYSLAKHENPDDADQTVYIPKIGTTAVDAENDTHTSYAGSTAVIVDTIAYENLVPGKAYTVSGQLVDRETQEVQNILNSTVDEDGNATNTVTYTFIPTEANGTVSVSFQLDASDMKGKTVVVFEELYLDDAIVAEHKDVEDEGQSIHFLNIGTTAINADNQTHYSEAVDSLTITDTVAYENLVPDVEYTVKGYLVDKTTGEAIPDTESETTFIPDAANGTVDVTFTLDASTFEGKSIVAYETLYVGKFIVAEHQDLTDEEQTIHVVSIGTTALDASTDSHLLAMATTEIVDTVAYKNLIPGVEYTVTGELMNKATGESTGIAAEATFTAETANGTVDVVFNVEGANYSGEDLVAFEKLIYAETTIASHEDIEDESQTVYSPTIGTTAQDASTATHVTAYGEEAKVIDAVAYEKLVVGYTYTIKGELVNKTTGESTDITAETTFTAEESNGTVDLTFVVDTTALQNTTLVAYETLYLNEVQLAEHKDIEDEAQTVYVPEIGTSAQDKATATQVVSYGETAEVVDTVKYENLVPGLEYTVKGTLMDKETGKALDATAEATFTPESSSGSVEITFTVNSKELAGTSLVAFEYLYLNDVEIAEHTDIEDEAQTVYVPEIGTTATDKATGTSVVAYGTEIEIEDTVAYTNLVPGIEYVVKGELMDKSTGESIGVTAEAKFTAEEANGTASVVFTVDSTTLAGKTLVAFETLFVNEVEVAEHKDIEDDAQTVYVPEIGTTATVNNSHKTVVSTSTELIDTVEYSNLVPGIEYTVKGVLMDKETGKAISANGAVLTATTTFTPTEANGTVTVKFNFDSSTCDGRSIVVFEDLMIGETIVATHSDLTDENQTVAFEKATPNTDAKTGDNYTPIIATMIVALGAGAGAAVLLGKKKKENED